MGYGYVGARTNTTQQSGQTADKEAEIKNITVYVSRYTETDTTGMLSPPTVWRQQSEFVWNRQDGQTRTAVRVGFECRCSVAVSMDTRVGLNIATRVCDLCSDKRRFAVLGRVWLQCNRNRNCIAGRSKRHRKL